MAIAHPARPYVWVLVLLAVTAAAPAATIDWTIGDIDGGAGLADTAVSTAGTLIEAANFGGTGVPNVTVNTVPFTGIDFGGGGSPINLAGLTYNNGQSGLGTSTGGQVDTLTNTIAFQSGVDPQTATLTGLVPGSTYETQFFLSHTTVSRTLTLSAGNAAVLRTRNPAQVATGTFTADAATQSITLDANTGSQFVNGYQLRQIPAPAPLTGDYSIDIDSQSLSGSNHTGPIATASGFVSLDATMPSNGDSVTLGPATFTVFSAGGSRVRATGGQPYLNALTADLLYDDGTNAAVGLRVYDLPKGLYRAQVWAYDHTSPSGNQIVGITQFTAGPEIIFTTDFASNPTDPYTFVFDSSNLPDGFGIFTRESSSSNRARFNALTLEKLVPKQIRVDVDVSGSPTRDGWASLNVSGASGSVVTQGVQFEAFSADGSRNRSGPNDLTRDFIFDDGSGQAVGLRVWDLPDGIWEAKVWAYDDAAAAGNQIVGITQFSAGPEIIFTTDFASNPTEPFSFIFDSRNLPNGFGIFTRENNSSNRARFNALQLTFVPEPATMALSALALAGLGGYVRQRKRA